MARGWHKGVTRGWHKGGTPKSSSAETNRRTVCIQEKPLLVGVHSGVVSGISAAKVTLGSSRQGKGKRGTKVIRSCGALAPAGLSVEVGIRRDVHTASEGGVSEDSVVERILLAWEV